MPTVNTTGTILMVNGQAMEVSMSVIEAKVMEVLRHSSIGAYSSMTARNPQQIAGGTALFRVPEMVQTGAYTNANKDNSPDATTMDTVEVQLDIRRKVTYEIETMDSSGFTNAGEIEAAIANGVSTAILAELDAFFMGEAQTAAAANTTTPPLINADYSSATSDSNVNTMYFQTIDQTSRVSGTIDRSMVGVDKTETVTIVNLSAKGRFIKAAGGGNTADKTFTGIVEQIGGVNLIEHVYIGKNVPIGASWSKDLANDFSTLEALMIHTEAIAMPFSLMSITQTQGENSGNPKFIAKYRFGLKTIRPKLVAGIFNVDPNLPLEEAKKQNVQLYNKVKQRKAASKKATA